MDLHHVAIKTPRVERLAEFYYRTLRLRKLGTNLFDDGGIRSVWLKAGKTIIMIERSCSKKARLNGAALIAFRIKKNERASWLRRLKKLRVKILSESSFSVYFSDPDGNPLALSHYPK